MKEKTPRQRHGYGIKGIAATSILAAFFAWQWYRWDQSPYLSSPLKPVITVDFPQGATLSTPLPIPLPIPAPLPRVSTTYTTPSLEVVQKSKTVQVYGIDAGDLLLYEDYYLEGLFKVDDYYTSRPKPEDYGYPQLLGGRWMGEYELNEAYSSNREWYRQFWGDLTPQEVMKQQGQIQTLQQENPDLFTRLYGNPATPSPVRTTKDNLQELGVRTKRALINKVRVVQYALHTHSSDNPTSRP